MTLGCEADWHVEAVDRFTGRVTVLPMYARISGERRRDDASTCRVVVPRIPACCDWVSDVVLWRHRLVVWRGTEIAWQGPVTGRSRITNGDTITLSATDDLAFAKVRRPRTAAKLSGDPTLLMMQLFTDTLGLPVDPVEFATALTLCGVARDLAWDPVTGRMAWDILRPLLDSVLDITMAGGVLYGGAVTNGTEPVATLTARHLDQALGIDEDGWQTATNIAARSDTLAVWPPEPGGVIHLDGRIGLIDGVTDRSDITTTAGLLTAAVDDWRQRKDLKVTIAPDGNGRLLPSAPVEFRDLIPGTRFTLEAEDDCGGATGVYDLDDMQFSIGSGGAYSRGPDGRFAEAADAETETILVQWATPVEAPE